jgi:hypothetical protein
VTEDARLALLRQLERADEAAALELAEIDELSLEAQELHARALELQELVKRLPEERAAAAEAVGAAERVLDEARAAAEQARIELVGAEKDGNRDRLAEARRFELRSRDSLHMAERAGASARERAARLDADAQAAERETAALERSARELSSRLAATSRLADEAVAPPEAGAMGVAEWGTRARAALLVGRSQLATERDAIVRQANELGAAVLGETLPPLGAAGIARRVQVELEAR